MFYSVLINHTPRSLPALNYICILTSKKGAKLFSLLFPTHSERHSTNICSTSAAASLNCLCVVFIFHFSTSPHCYQFYPFPFQMGKKLPVKRLASSSPSLPVGVFLENKFLFWKKKKKNKQHILHDSGKNRMKTLCNSLMSNPFSFRGCLSLHFANRSFLLIHTNHSLIHDSWNFCP